VAGNKGYLGRLSRFTAIIGIQSLVNTKEIHKRSDLEDKENQGEQGGTSNGG